MEASNSSKPPLSPAVVSSTSVKSRRDSLNSISTVSQVDKEQLAQALDKIHTTASQSDVLTTFNDYAPPPSSAPPADSKGTTGDLVHQSISGLYSRLKEAVGVGNKGPAQELENTEAQDVASRKGKAPASLTKVDSGEANSALNISQPSDTPTATTSSSRAISTELSTQAPHSSKASSVTTVSTAKSTQPVPNMVKAAAPSAADPAVAPVTVNAFKDKESTRGVTTRLEDSGRGSVTQTPEPDKVLGASQSSSAPDVGEAWQPATGDGMMTPRSSRREDSLSHDGSSDTALTPVKGSTSGASALQIPRSREAYRKPAVIDRIARSRTPADMQSRTSSMEAATAEPSPVSMSAHGSVYHESFKHNEKPEQLRSGGMRIPGTTADEGAPEMVNHRLEAMRKQVLSKEFWMADETTKECFLCNAPFSAFRRKHHCRTCGCIFDSKCTSTISGQKFGVPGTLRACKKCLGIINARYDDGSDDSADESYLPAIFRPNRPKLAQTTVSTLDEDVSLSERVEDNDNRVAATPMMAIPATRRIGTSANRHSAVLEIDSTQLSRPSSSRSLRSLASGRPQSAGHKRHHSKHNFLGRLKGSPAQDNAAPFRKSANEELQRKSKLPAFHDDNIIDPELAPYMSEESSGDEQMSIFATMNTSDITPSSLDPEKSNFGPFLSAGRRHRARGEKSISGLSFTSRGPDDANAAPSVINHGKPTRRRNMSTTSNTAHHLRSPRPRSGIFGKGPAASSESLGVFDMSIEPTKLTRSNSIRDKPTKKDQELPEASLLHIKKLLGQLLEDANVPHAGTWEKALVPILIRCSSDVDPDTREGDSMDIRHYVKFKKIPGGKPGDTSYVSGVIFTKNLALKSMARRIANPRIVLVSFPIEYQRHEQVSFMSLQPVIEQEKEYLRMVVNRIANLRPHVLLAEKSVSGVALQYLSENGIAVAYNVKQEVLEAVSRCARADIISSLDMLALPTQVGQAGGFEVKTYVNNDFPGRKKTYIFISGCTPSLGCTIGLRGASTDILARMKGITEFMIYVVYNLRLESSLLHDHFLCLSNETDGVTTPAPSHQGLGQSLMSLTSSGNQTAQDRSQTTDKDADGSQVNSQAHSDPSTTQETGQTPDAAPSEASEPRKKLFSLHENHSLVSQDSHVPEDVPMPTYYSDMVAKYKTKILSASPCVRFTQPYLLMRAREQERRLEYLKRLRDQDVVQEQGDSEKAKPQKFQLIKPEMVHEIGQKAPRHVMEILHAVHDAEYDKALHNYQVQTRQWESYISGSLDLFDPYSHQNIVVLHSRVCTETKIPCSEPGLICYGFYCDDPVGLEEPDRTFGQYIEDACANADAICRANGCDRQMTQHHDTYVHDEARITVFIEKNSPLPFDPATIKKDENSEQDEIFDDPIYMWSFCKLCKKDMGFGRLSEASRKYSFGKYLELSFWSRGLKFVPDLECPHDYQKDHIRYFSYNDTVLRIHYDPIDLLEIIVPRPRLTWKVDLDLKLKNDIFTKSEDRWSRFMSSVKTRLKSIRIDSVLPEKAENCKAEVERLTKKSQEDQPRLTRDLQNAYVNSKYYEVIPLNVVVRGMLEKVAEWDAAFTKFESDFLSDKDVRQLTIIQLKKMFSDNESRESLPTSTTDGTSIASADTEDKGSPPATQTNVPEPEEKASEPSQSDLALSATSQQDQSGGSVEENRGDKPPCHAESVNKDVDPSKLTTSSDPALAKSDEMAGGPPPEEAKPQTDNDENSQQPAIEGPKGPERSEAATKEPASKLPVPSHSQTTPVPPPLNPTLSFTEKVEQLRRQRQAMGSESSLSPESTAEPPKVPERGSPRRAGLTVSPPIARATSQPIGVLPRVHTNLHRSVQAKEAKGVEMPTGGDVRRTSTTDSSRSDKSKLSDRFGLAALKNKKVGQSSIPRYVHGKRKESKVSTLARHFEQLSREFEKERIRDRKQRAAKMQPSRAYFPRTSTKAIVEVYDDVDQAVQEAGPSDDDHPAESQQSHQKSATTDTTADISGPGTAETSQAPSVRESPTSPEPPALLTETSPEGETDEHKQASQAESDEEGGASDADQSLLEDFLPDVQEIAESLDSSEEIPLELPKHQKSSLMKMLTTFWAERSASGWPQLDYPVNITDHIFIDSDVIVREDEPSSLIAFALSSEDYQAKLSDICRQWKVPNPKGSEDGDASDTKSFYPSDSGSAFVGEEELEQSLLRTTGTHLKYQFTEGSAKMLCKIFFAEQFDALRKKCGAADRIVESLSRCLKWDSKGGKTKSVFLKTLDDRLVMKSLSPIETQAFLRFAPAYFEIMAEALFHDLPSVIAKMLGFFQVIIKNPVTNTEIKLDLLVMENLFYDRSPTRIFDLKGSMRNRKIQSTGEQNEVLLDENMVEYIYESPLFAREHSKKLLRASVWNDTLFLARQNVMDYSLMIAVDENRKELVVGIIDCIRTYTWDKRVEWWIKDRGFAGGGRNKPTVTSPKEYKSRFREAMGRYILQAPNCWHHFGDEGSGGGNRARFEGDA